MALTLADVLAWLEESRYHVLEYSADCHRAFIQDEDAVEHPFIPVAIARQLLANGQIAVWRYIGQWNRGYHSYRPTAWVEEWKRVYGVEVEVAAARLALSNGK
ncbi:MAG: hypothetical protein H0X24_00020 [Ktedonobacterales bacterium]|nr:hypothetical protein [Ktedonobacterales bacterium]